MPTQIQSKAKQPQSNKPQNQRKYKSNQIGPHQKQSQNQSTQKSTPNQAKSNRNHIKIISYQTKSNKIKPKRKRAKSNQRNVGMNVNIKKRASNQTSSQTPIVNQSKACQMKTRQINACQNQHQNQNKKPTSYSTSNQHQDHQQHNN